MHSISLFPPWWVQINQWIAKPVFNLTRTWNRLLLRRAEGETLNILRWNICNSQILFLFFHYKCSQNGHLLAVRKIGNYYLHCLKSWNSYIFLNCTSTHLWNPHPLVPNQTWQVGLGYQILKTRLFQCSNSQKQYSWHSPVFLLRGTHVGNVYFYSNVQMENVLYKGDFSVTTCSNISWGKIQLYSNTASV